MSNYLIDIGDNAGTPIKAGSKRPEIRFQQSGPRGPAGAQGGRITEVAVDTTLTVLHGVVNVDTSGGAVIITLPLTSSLVNHGLVVRRDGASTVTVNVTGPDTFDDLASSKVLSTDSAAIGIMSVGDAEWKITGVQGTVS